MPHSSSEVTSPLTKKITKPPLLNSLWMESPSLNLSVFYCIFPPIRKNIHPCEAGTWPTCYLHTRRAPHQSMLNKTPCRDFTIFISPAPMSSADAALGREELVAANNQCYLTQAWPEANISHYWGHKGLELSVRNAGYISCV